MGGIYTTIQGSAGYESHGIHVAMLRQVTLSQCGSMTTNECL